MTIDLKARWGIVPYFMTALGAETLRIAVFRLLLAIIFTVGVSGCGHFISLKIDVVDQNEEPIAGADIVYDKKHYTLGDLIGCFAFAGCGSFEEFNTSTDKNGHASFFVYGSHLSVRSIKYPGYYISGGYVNYGDDKTIISPAQNSLSNSKDTVVIKAWKILPLANQLIEGGSNTTGSFPSNSLVNIVKLSKTPVYLKVEWGKFLIEKDEPMPMKVQIMDGEIQETNDLYPYSAKEDGYSDEWSGEIERYQIKRMFYFRDKQKRYYGFIEIEFQNWSRYERHLNYTYRVNLAGERNVQPAYIERGNYRPPTGR